MEKSDVPGGPSASTVDASAGNYLTQVFAVAAAELQKLFHDPIELLTRAVQPVLWLMLFGEVMARVRGVAPGGIPYLDFLAAGILAQSALFVAIFYSISALWERDLGILQRYLVSPAPRSALVAGKALSAGVRGLSQTLIVYLLALLLGVGVSLDPIHIVGVAAVNRAGFGAVLDTFAHHRLYCEDARAVHGHWSGDHDADLLRQQRDLSVVADAELAESRLACQSAHIRG
jgi:ABC-2 type transport system permease protein